MSDKTCLYLWSAAAAVLAALCAAAAGPAYLNHDAAWYLHMVDVWLDGGTLYRSVIDTNPPLIVFLTAVPVLAARMLALFEPMAFMIAPSFWLAWLPVAVAGTALGWLIGGLPRRGTDAPT